MLTMQAMNTFRDLLKTNGWTVSMLARELGVKPQAISQWTEVPVARVKAVSDATGIPPHLMRPDHWDAPKKRRVAA